MQKQTAIQALLKNDLFLLFVILITILTSFILFVAKVSSILIPQKRAALLQNFINDMQKKQDIDLRQYWEFREFYSPGSFNYEKNGLFNKNDMRIMSLISQDPSVTPKLLFSSERVTSIGGRTKVKKLSAKNSYPNILLQTSSLVLSENETTIFLIFLKPVSEVKKANGFLQYEQTHDEKQGDLWLEITTIQK